MPKGQIVTKSKIMLEISGDIPEWAQPEVQSIMDQVCAVEKDRVLKAFEHALADHFGAGVLGDQSDA